MTQAEEQELKKDIENLKLLADRLLTKKNDKTTSMNFPESKNAEKYVKEVDTMEHPENYYHFQDGWYGIEIKKAKGWYKVITYGFTIERTKLEEDTGFTNKWTYGKITGEYWNEDLNTSIKNYYNAIKQYLDFPKNNEKLRNYQENIIQKDDTFRLIKDGTLEFNLEDIAE